MIKEKDNRLFEAVLFRYVTAILKKNFHEFIIVNDFPVIPNGNGLIVTPNHFSWWDGFLVKYLFYHFTKRRLSLMMLEEQLNKFKFLSYLGAFSINPGSVTGVRESLLHSASIVNNPDKFLVIYPQGEIQELGIKEIVIKEGLKTIINSAGKFKNRGAFVLPVAFKTEYGSNKYPTIFCRFGELLNAEEVVNNSELFKKTFTDNINSLLSKTYTSGKKIL